MSDECLSPLDDFQHLGRLEHAPTQYVVGARRMIPFPPATPRPHPSYLPPRIDERMAWQMLQPRLHPILDIHEMSSRQLGIIDLRNPGAVDLVLGLQTTGDPGVLRRSAMASPVNEVVIVHDCLRERVIVRASERANGVSAGDVLLTLIRYLQSWEPTGNSRFQKVELLRGRGGFMLKGFSVDQGTTLRLHVGGIGNRRF